MYKIVLIIFFYQVVGLMVEASLDGIFSKKDKMELNIFSNEKRFWKSLTEIRFI